MPCVRCSARQTDPVRGPSPWKSGVQAGRQVLVCPDCQRSGDWTADLDRCTACGSTMLVRRLGETSCRACGFVGPGESVVLSPGLDEPAPHWPAVPGLADEVAAALARVLGR